MPRAPRRREPGISDLLRAVVNNLPIILYAFTPDGTVVLAEGQGLAAVGSSPTAAVGSDVWTLFADEPENLAHIERALQGETAETEVYFARFGRRYHAWYVPSFDAEGRVALVTGLALDITEGTRLVATMSHEIRTPLNAVLGFAQLLESQNFGPLNERQRRYVNHIRATGTHLLELVNEVLDLSKVHAGQLRVQTSAIGLGVVVEEVGAQLAPLAEQRGVEVFVRAQPQHTVLADRFRLRQVLVNLLSNAIKFTPAGGSVTVTTVEWPAEVWVAIADTGVGIAPSDQERIFSAFEQVADPAGLHVQGTGLGLALSRELARAMGGDIHLDTGSTFTLRLRRADARA